MGSPVKKRNGKWQIRWVDARGHRRGQTFSSRSVAVRVLRRYETEVEEVRAGLRDPRREQAQRRTFRELADYWLEHRTAHKRSPRDDHVILRNHLLPAFATVKLWDLDTQRIDELRTKLLENGRAPNTVQNILGLLSAMLTKAVDIGWLATKPKIVRPKPVPHDYNWIDSLESVRALVATAAEEEARVSFPGICAMYATSVYTGARAGEVAGLKWSMVDFDARLITIARSFTKPTKTQHIRRVPILDPLLPILREWRLRCPVTEGDWAFPNRRGKMHVPTARIFTSTYHRVLARAGVKGHNSARRLTYHDLRHSFASLWMQQGGDIFRLQKILGHQSVQMTLRYAHLAPGVFVDDYQRLGDRSPVNAGAVIYPFGETNKQMN